MAEVKNEVSEAHTDIKAEVKNGASEEGDEADNNSVNVPPSTDK